MLKTIAFHADWHGSIELVFGSIHYMHTLGVRGFAPWHVLRLGRLEPVVIVQQFLVGVDDFALDNDVLILLWSFLITLNAFNLVLLYASMLC